MGISGNSVSKKLPGGMKVDIIKPGEGPMCQPGAQVMIHYTGKLLSGKVFDSSV